MFNHNLQSFFYDDFFTACLWPSELYKTFMSQMNQWELLTEKVCMNREVVEGRWEEDESSNNSVCDAYIYSLYFNPLFYRPTNLQIRFI